MKRLTTAIATILFGNLLFSQNLDSLKLNQIQVIGSHNSYKKAIAPEVLAFLEKSEAAEYLPNIEYEHISILDQLDMGLRNLEIDVYADSNGGKYKHPKIMDYVKANPTFDPENKMTKPGFKMIHILDIDYQTWYYTLEDCLRDLKKWSDKHPNHHPVFITLEPKDGTVNKFGTEPEHFTTKLFDDLDSELLKYLGRNKILTPDDVRGDYQTLNNAVLHENWPKINSAKGKFIFVIDNNGANRDQYIKNHPSLKGRMMFTDSSPGTEEAAILIMNNPDENITKLVKKGYIIRTRADADTKEARAEDFSRFDRAKSSGAQIITTDYYLPSKLFKSKYKVNFDNQGFERKNPITGP